MSSLTYLEKTKFEALFEMKSGYVLDFSDRSFREFFLDNININIDSQNYLTSGPSKAKRMRTFWNTEADHLVGKLLFQLVEYWKFLKAQKETEIDQTDYMLYTDCLSIADRLLKSDNAIDNSVFDLKSLNPTWKKISTEVINYINNNDPEGGLDRLHSFLVCLFRELNRKHNLPFEHEIPLGSLCNNYLNYLHNNHFFESELGEKVISTNVKNLDKFNYLRTNKSLAQPNPILNHDESLLIFENITAIIRFIKKIENFQ